MERISSRTGSTPRRAGRPGVRYVVCYDIADDYRRGRIADAQLDFGPRCRESVFVFHLGENLYGNMKGMLERLIDPAIDKVHVFRLCAACEPSTAEPVAEPKQAASQ